MLPRPARYLIRFDDLCPTVSSRRWQRFVGIIREYQLKPILAVIPDNRDYKLQQSPADPNFWEEMRTLEADGATIGLHGYQHLCNSWGHSILKLHKRTEFAGVREEVQREWIRTGMRILRAEGLNPRIWVAPRHGFDESTLHILPREGVKMLSDGFARVPHTRGGMIWIPQQLWGPVRKSSGVWTICVHANSASGNEYRQLLRFVRENREQILSVDEVLALSHPGPLSAMERLYESFAQFRSQMKHTSKRLSRKRIRRNL